MGPSRLSLKRMLLLTTFVALCLFATTVRAQNDNTDSPDPTTGNNNGNNDDNNNDSEATTTANNQEETTSTTERTSESTRVSISQVTTRTETTQTASSAIPSITGTTQSFVAGPSDLPTLTGIYNTFSYPPPSVPPTANAPFMQTSSLPDGTVFIAVGAILGAFGAAILIWRGVMACLLHRTVEKAGAPQQAKNTKAFPAPPAQFYKYSDQESKLSVGARRTTRGPVPSNTTPSQTNLFFSPTAPGQGHQSRDSRASFLPNGFYPSNTGGSSPQNGLGHQPSISLTNLRPTSRGQVASIVGPSPPDSPSFGPRSTPGLRNASSSSLNRPPSQRAPSAYLEDLLDENPHMFPPQGGAPPMPPQPPQHGGQARY